MSNGLRMQPCRTFLLLSATILPATLPLSMGNA